MVIARAPGGGREKLNQAISYGMDELTKPYDNFEILRIGFRILFNVSRRSRDRKYICSELVYECFDRIGVPFHLRDEYVVRTISGKTSRCGKDTEFYSLTYQNLPISHEPRSYPEYAPATTHSTHK